MSRTKTVLACFLAGLLLLAIIVCAGAWYWSERPVAMADARIDYLVEPGSSPRQVARTLKASGMDLQEDAFVAMARILGQDTQIKAGAYEAEKGDSPRMLLDRMTAGDMRQSRLALIEGWTYQRIRQVLRDSPDVEQTLDDVDDDAILERLGADADAAEGLFYPDTYVFTPGTTDFDLLRRAYVAQNDVLEQAWEERDKDLPLRSAYDALILASIVEKETGHAQDRAKIAGVFMNRLRINMALQTDPTVIYGMGEAYQGRLRKKDLQQDTPWNTYTRPGLPPTPIASVSRASLDAVLHPESHDYLYFVSRGDGTSEFSTSLAAHNRAVSKFILGRNKQ